ncbi:hypothetical protein [Sorangium sp. So ce341]|uniref:hypothetical protein n=1 Tax=Sorangium sp. So ce341 TaxID=3133302 RepID=UPI003F60ECF5
MVAVMMVAVVMVAVVMVAVMVMAVMVMAVMVMAVMVMAVMVMAVMMMAVMMVAVVPLASVHSLGGDLDGHLLDQREILDRRGGVRRCELRAAEHRRGCREDGDQFDVLHRRLLLHGAPERGATELAMQAVRRFGRNIG